jgi:hypothetical protein
MSFHNNNNKLADSTPSRSENRTSQQIREEFSKAKPIVSFSSPYSGKSPRLPLQKSKTLEKISRKSTL